MAPIRKRRTGWQVQVRRINYPPISKTFRLKSDAEVWTREQEAEIDGHTEPLGIKLAADRLPNKIIPATK